MDRSDQKQRGSVTSPENPDSLLSSPLLANASAGAASGAASSANTLRKEIRVWTRDLLIAIGLALVIIVFLYQPVQVVGTSMAPLLSDQELIFVNKFVYSLALIQRGGVVVFCYLLYHRRSFI